MLDITTLLPNERINRLENALRLGRIDRSRFLYMAGESGLSASASESMADRTLSQRGAIARSRADLRATYDYIIVGAGAAGCVLAYRLTENPAVRVLVLETGGTDVGNVTISDPALWVGALNSPIDYAYTTVPQHGTADRVQVCPRGKVLGGSTSINGLIWARGMPADFDGWASEGNVGWDYATLLPLYRRMETFAGGSDKYRGGDGPLHLEHPVNPNPLAAAYIEAAVEVGLPRVHDLNGATTFGAGWTDLTIKDQRRFSAAQAFLHPAMERPNLTVMTEARVLRLALKGTTVHGVVVQNRGETFTIDVDQEVLLCAGAIDSPRVLMMSGIGPADHLRSLGIANVVDLPVGNNLHDHVLASGVMIQIKQDALPPPRNNGSEAVVYAKSDSGLKDPDIQMPFYEFPFTFYQKFTPPPNCFTIGPGNLRPESRGQLRLTSVDPDVQPAIDPCYLKSEADAKVLAIAIELAREIAGAKAFSEWRRAEVLPGPLNRQEMNEFIRHATTTYVHPVGTCRMGVDDEAVVRPDLKVRGIERLRVADASIMPTIPRGNTMGPTMLIGEKVFDLIGSRGH